MGRKRRTGNPNHAIAALAGRQHGIVSRNQLRALGLTDEAIDVRTTSGFLHPIFRGAFAVGHLSTGRRGRMLAAVLACGEGTVVSHGSAAELIGLWDKTPVSVDVIPPRRAGRKLRHVRWHNVLRPGSQEVELREGIPCTTPARTLVDMAGQLGRGSLRQMVERAAVLRALHPEEVDRVLARGRRRGAPQLRAILDGWRSEEVPRLRSPLEARLLHTLLETGLPRPKCNVMLEVDGHRLEVDMLWREQRLVVEIDGQQTHGTRAAFGRDRWRDQVLMAAGYRTARVTWAQLEEEPEGVVRRIRRMLGAA